jgi:poly-gamma-glutamate capsule biosynthesis protein CapA/YwtB (metallophosphatase superfamily)
MRDQFMKIAFAGDVMLGRLVNQALRKRDAASPWGGTLSVLSQADLRICNLECVLSDCGTPWSRTPKMFHFRSDEKNIKTLQAAKIDLISIANNHVLDYEESALFRMLEVLEANKMPFAGAGKNFAQASSPAIVDAMGQKIGFLAFTDNEPGWEAKENKPGVYYIPVNMQDKRAKELFKKVETLRSAVDFLIVSAHWGPNWGYQPPREQIPFAHALIDAGADLIFGHSGHIFRGIEVYKKRPILYCTGDFIDDYAVDPSERNDESFIFLLERGSKITLYPTIIDNFQAQLAEPPHSQAILYKMEALCQKLGTPFACGHESGEILY